MKIKVLTFIIVLILSIAMLVACQPSTEPEVSENVSERFILVESFKPEAFSSSAAYVLVDTETNVCYLLVVESQGAGLTVMVDAEGNPLLWEGPLNNQEKENENLD